MPKIGMHERLGKHHLRQQVSKLIDDKELSASVLALIDSYIATVQSDRSELLDGIRQLKNKSAGAERRADELLEQFEPGHLELSK